MSDYIDRDLLLAEIEELKKSPWYNGGYGTYERNIRREAIDIIVDLCIRPAPAADAQVGSSIAEHVYRTIITALSAVQKWMEVKNE